MDTKQCDICKKNNIKSGNKVGSSDTQITGPRVMSLHDYGHGHINDICKKCEQAITDLIVTLYHGSE